MMLTHDADVDSCSSRLKWSKLRSVHATGLVEVVLEHVLLSLQKASSLLNSLSSRKMV